MNRTYKAMTEAVFTHPTYGNCKVITTNSETTAVRNIFSGKIYILPTSEVWELVTPITVG